MIRAGEIPFVRLLVPIMAGIYLGYYFDSGIYEYGYAISLLLLFIFGIVLSAYKKLRIYRRQVFPGSLIYLIVGLAGYTLVVDASQRFDQQHYRNKSADCFVIEIGSEPKMADSIIRFESRVVNYFKNGRSYPGKGKLLVSLQLASGSPGYNYGDLLICPAQFNAIDPPFNPAEFDYRAYLADRQIYYQAFLVPGQYHLIKSDAGNPVISFALKLRRRLVEKFYRHIPDQDAAAFASTLILGYRAELSRELVEAYSKTGTMHVLSVSGMHVGIVFLVLSFLLKFMDTQESRRLVRAALVISLIWFYAMITGFSVPASRAALMLSFIVLGKALNRKQNTYNLIAISAFFLLLYNPFYLFDVGFQLSYLAVTGLVYFQPKIYHALYIKSKSLDYIWAYCALSLAAQLATFPLSIYYFHQFPVYFLISNLLIVLPVAIIMYAGILFMLLPWEGMLSYLGGFLDRIITLTNDSLLYIEQMPLSSLDGIWIDRFQLMLFGLILLAVMIRISFERTVVIPVSILIFLFCLRWAYVQILNDRRHEIIFYNLRSSSAFAHLYRGRSVVVSNTGREDKLSAYSVLPALQSRGSSDEEFFRPEEVFLQHARAGLSACYQFGSYRILRWDKTFDGHRFTAKLRVDALFLSGNPRASLTDLARYVRFSIAIIDANNPDYKVKGWIAEAKALKMPYYVLKKNAAYIVKL